LGAFLITATATGVDIFYYTQGNIDYASRWLARGFVTAAVVYAFSEISGAHADPAVTLGFFLRRVFPAPLALAYVAAQFAGAFAAAALWLAFAGPSILALGASHPGPHVSQFTATIAEVIATFALMLTILMMAQEKPAVGQQAAVAVGFMVAACGFVAGPISGASMNPARTIAPQILAGAYGNIWIYVVGPLLGAAIAAGVHAFICGAPSSGEQHAARGKR